jgi:disulfide bond formation protein DsbB
MTMKARSETRPSVRNASTDQTALWTLAGILLALVVVWMGGVGIAFAVGSAWTACFSPTPESVERDRLASLKPGENLDVDMVAHGKSIFTSTCASCHGQDARGLPGKGKPLTTSLFTIRKTDPQLVEFIKTGRPITDPMNTTKVDMPARGGNPTLTDDDLVNVVAFLRSAQRPERVSYSALAKAEERVRVAEARAEAEQAAARAAKKAEKEKAKLAAAKPAANAAAASAPAGAPAAPTAAAPATTTPATPTTVAATPVAASAAPAAAPAAEEEDTETIAWGGELFVASCSACHGKDAKGLPKNGKDLVHSVFAKGLKDEELIAFIKRGRDPGDPLNTTKIAMPPKGGNPALSDEKIEAIVAYVRSLQKSATN